MRAILFDFFGTLVDYDPARVPAVFPATAAFSAAAGIGAQDRELIAVWEHAFERLDAETDASMREYSMAEVGAVALGELLNREPTAGEAEGGAAAYLADWGRAILPFPGVADALALLGRDHVLAVVSNTHGTTLVQDTLRSLGVAHLLAAVVTSVDVGWWKPHPAVFRAALDAVGCAASEALFVGDSKLNDFEGPRAAGLESVLIAPTPVAGVPESHRLPAVTALPAWLAPRPT